MRGPSKFFSLLLWIYIFNRKNRNRIINRKFFFKVFVKDSLSWRNYTKFTGDTWVPWEPPGPLTPAAGATRLPPPRPRPLVGWDSPEGLSRRRSQIQPPSPQGNTCDLGSLGWAWDFYSPHHSSALGPVPPSQSHCPQSPGHRAPHPAQRRATS